MATSEASQRAITQMNPNRSGQGETRRGAVGLLLAAWGIFILGAHVGLLGILRFLMPNVLFEPPLSFKAGFATAYGVGVDETFKLSHGVWLVRSLSDPESDRAGVEGIFALSTTCTHLGCIPNWMAADLKFKCPCHGSGFRQNGINFEGPAPRPLERYRIVRAEDGQILVDKNMKYQWEKGQWISAESFLAV